MKKRILTTLTMFALICSVVCAQAPNNTGTYYMNADGKKGQALKTAMFNIINGYYNGNKFKQISYGSGRLNGVWGAFQKTDVLANGTTIRDRYSNITHYTVGDDQGSSSANEGEGGYNREHSFPKSWFGNSTAAGPGTDLHHIYPTDVTVNSHRGNLPYGENNGESYKSANGYSKCGICTFVGSEKEHFTNECFEPDDEWKGDFARAYFYMVTCYESSQTSWSSEMLSGNAYPAFKEWAINLLLKWATQDPVSDIEIARNEAVCGYQYNRNPFIDYPGLEQYIWGSKQTKAFSYNNYEGGGGTTDKEDVTMTFSATSVTATLGQAFTAPTLSTTPSGLAVVYSSSDTNVATVDSSTGNVTLLAAGTTTITATFDGNANYNASTASYQLTVVKQGDDPTPITGDGIFQLVTSTSDLESGKRYLIVSGTVSLTKLDGTAGTGSVTINSSQIDMNNADNTGLILTLEKVGDYWTVKGNDVYMALTSDKNALNTSTTATAQTAKWTIMVDSESASITNSKYTSRSLKYNSGSNMFRCYTTGQQDVQLYKELEKEIPVVLRGDVNGDGQVTIADVTSLVNIILGSQGGDTSVADLNGDSQITIADVTSLVNIILGKGR